jgi:hypothetical protein
MTGFQGEVPANLQCGFCRRPIQGAFYRALNRFACAECAGKVQGVIDRNVFAPDAFAMAAVAGFLTAVAGAAAWAAIVHATHLALGIVAALIGVFVGKAVVRASGNRRGVALQWLAVVLAFVGVIGGKFALVCWWIADGLGVHGAAVTATAVWSDLAKQFQRDPRLFVQPFDLLWAGIAVFAAWRICRAPRITIAGPYRYAPATGTGLQFQTVEPAGPAGTADAQTGAR